MASDPFSEETLRLLFDTSSRNPDCLKRRESTWLEFKENFHLAPDAKAEYVKSLAAFANNNGGYIIYGVQNRPHRLVGMTNEKFFRLDPTTITDLLNEQFAPLIAWAHYVHEIGDKRFGILYAFEAKVKPVMSIRQFEHIRDGDIFFRYQGESRLIKSPDLQAIIMERLENERRSWRELLQRTSRIEPSSTYLLDINEGKADGPGRSFMVDERLLDMIKFIHEGRFAESGDPTLRLVGNVEVTRTVGVPEHFEEVPVDPSKFCNLWENEVVRELRRYLGDVIQFGDTTKSIKGTFVRDVIKAHDIPSPSKMYYRPDKEGSRAQYGPELVQWMVGQYFADKQFFAKAKLTAQARK